MGSMAFLFPGQGSQKVGMGLDFAERHPELRSRYFDAADEILGMPLSQLCFSGPDEELRDTANTQPAIFTTSVAILDVLRSAGLRPAAVAGHSLGEYSALVCAGALTFEQALPLVRRRGELMSQVNARTPGAMAAVIGPRPDEVDAICAQVRADGTGVVEAANYNEPAQTVISGEVAAVEAAMAAAAEAGARVVRLQVGAPFHCSLMDVLTEEFGAALDAVPLRDPEIPVIANVTGDVVKSADDVRAALRRQVAGAVRWTDTMRRLVDDGCDTFVEVGPGRVLSGLAAKNAPGTTVRPTADVAMAERVVAELGP